MPALQFGTSSYERAEGDIAALPVVNMYAEASPSEGVVLQSRPGLSDRVANMGSGPVRALYKRDGVVGGALLGVSGEKLYSGSTEVGTVLGSGPVSIAGNETGAMICAGNALHCYNGFTFADVPLPDDFNALKVIEGASRFVILRAGSGRYYFTPPLAQTVDALDFATAESESDQVLDALFIDDILILFGAETVEYHANTTDNNLPFRAIEGRVIERGIKATGCATPFGPTFAWVTDQNTVCVGAETNIVSNEGLEERIAASSAVSLWRFFIDGIEFLALRIDNETQVYSFRSQQWSEFASADQSNWIPCCYAGGVFGSAIDGRTLQWGSDKTDLGGTLERRFRAGAPINGGGMGINRLSLRCNPGQAPTIGTYASPKCEMRLSRDAGRTWGTFRDTSLGTQGSYRQRIEWRALGMASQPGFLAEFRVTDPVDFRPSGVFYNEAWGGR